MKIVSINLGNYSSTGSIAQGITDTLTPAHGRAVIQYMIAHPETYAHGPHTQSGEGTDKNGRKRK